MPAVAELYNERDRERRLLREKTMDASNICLPDDARDTQPQNGAPTSWWLGLHYMAMLSTGYSVISAPKQYTAAWPRSLLCDTSRHGKTDPA